MTDLWRRLRADRKGATAIEYGLICSLIVIVMIGGLMLFSGATLGIWTAFTAKIMGAAS